MSSVVVTKGSEEPWTIDTVVKFIDLLGYRVVTLKTDTEPAIVAFRNRVAEKCKAEVATEDAGKGDKPSNGLMENTAMSLRGSIRTIKCQKGRDGRTPSERQHGKKPSQEFVPFGEKVLARQIASEPMNGVNSRYKSGMSLGMAHNSA